MFVSHKRRRKVRSSFGFVMFKYKQEAEEAIEHLDGMVILGHRIEVSLAGFGKRNHEGIQEKNKVKEKGLVKEVWKNDGKKEGEDNTDQKLRKVESDLMKHNQHDGIALVVHGEVCEENVEWAWLKRSLVGEVNQLREVDSISERVSNTGLLSRGSHPLESAIF